MVKNQWKKWLVLVVSVMILAVVAGCGGAPAADKKPEAKPVAAAFKPDKPVTLIVPMAAGGSTDMLARAVEKVWSKHCPQPLLQR